MSVSAVTKKKKVSKKNRSAWRKHADIKDVEEFLEERRQEERIGTFSGKKDEELFTIDASADKKLLKTPKQNRKENAKKPLKTFSALENTSKVQDPIAKRNHVKQKKSGRNLEEEVLNPKNQRHIQANKDRQRFNDKLDKKLSRDKTAKVFQSDIWAEQDVLQDYPALKNQWVSKELSLYQLRNLGKPVVKVHDSIRHKTIKAKKFQLPHPGMSYNPSLSDHRDLLNKVVEKEEEIIKKEKHLKRVTTAMFSKVTEEDRDSAQIAELSVGLDEEDVEVNQENEDGDRAYKTVNPPVENKKKDKKARRKQLEQKQLTKELQKKKEVKKQRTDLHRLRSLTSEVAVEEEQLNELRKHRKKVEYQKKFETKRLSKLKFQEPDVDINMPEDIPGNLRNVKPESSLLVDKFKDFQKQNILPASADLGGRKRRKIKRFVRNTHKESPVTISKKK